jgi:hypothetical protein|tara:strand:- start:412 stop:561 length:150 start_codon:yes stop_codon:yes gene_type:complete
MKSIVGTFVESECRGLDIVKHLFEVVGIAKKHVLMKGVLDNEIMIEKWL